MEDLSDLILCLALFYFEVEAELYKELVEIGDLKIILVYGH